MPLQGELFKVHIETAVAGTYVIMEFMNSYSKGSDSDESRFHVFNRSTPLVIAADPGESFSIGGFYDPADPGQLRAITKSRDGTDVLLKVLPDGVNGFTQLVKILRHRHEASADPGFQLISFECVAQAPAVISGTGPIL